MKVSIIVPVYNAERYLEETVRSLLAQTYRDIEVILVDDGSKDGSAAICARFEKADSRVRVAAQENKGPSAARNTGLSLAEGEYVMFVDCDDIVHPDTLEKMVRRSQRTDAPAELVFAGYALYHEGEDIRELTPRCRLGERQMTLEDIAQLFASAHTSLTGVAVWGKLYSMELIRRSGASFDEDVRYEEDCRFNLQVYRCVQVAASIDDILVYYRMRPDSISKAVSGQQFLWLVGGYEARRAFARELGMEQLAGRMEDVFFIVVMTQLKRAADADLTAAERRRMVRHILAQPQSRSALAGRGRARSLLERMTALFGARNLPEPVFALLSARRILRRKRT